MAEAPQKTVRIIAFAAKNVGVLKTVNIVTTRAAADVNAIKSCLQATGAPKNIEYPTYMDSGGGVKGLPTIHIAGYAGPL